MPTGRQPRSKTVLSFERLGEYTARDGTVYQGAYWTAQCNVCEELFDQFHRTGIEGELRVHYAFIRVRCPTCREKKKDQDSENDPW